jgi:hypothetical protein
MRLHVITPILFSVGVLFDGEAAIAVEEDLTGDFIEAHGQFELMMRRVGTKLFAV